MSSVETETHGALGKPLSSQIKFAGWSPANLQHPVMNVCATMEDQLCPMGQHVLHGYSRVSKFSSSASPSSITRRSASQLAPASHNARPHVYGFAMKFRKFTGTFSWSKKHAPALVDMASGLSSELSRRDKQEGEERNGGNGGRVVARLRALPFHTSLSLLLPRFAK